MVNEKEIKWIIQQKDELQKDNMLLHNACEIIANQNRCLMEKVQPIDRKAKPKLVDRKLTIMTSGEIAIVGIYDDKKYEIQTLLTEIKGPWKVYRVEMEEDWQIPLFVIHFEGTDDWIVGEIPKIKKSYFYNLLIQYGVHFDTKISRNAIGQVLYETFAGEVYMTNKSIHISALAGWKNGRFQFRKNFLLNDQFCVSKFPVMRKNFEVLEFQKDTAQVYFQEMNCIKNLKNRFILIAYPFLASISSILAECEMPLNFGINIIDLGDLDKRRVCGWLQIFNRDVCMPISCDMTEKKLHDLLCCIKDESLILDCIQNPDDSDYRNREKQRTVRKISHTILHGEILEGRLSQLVYAGVVLISDQFQQGKEIYNIYAMEKWVESNENRFRLNKAMERILSDFMRYVENNMDEVKEIIMKDRRYRDEKANMLEIGYEILSQYWIRKGVYFREMMGLKIKFDFDSFFDESSYDESEILDLFIMSFRRGVEEYYFIEKNMKKKRECAIYFTDDFLWIPVKIFDEILKHSGIKILKNRIMEQLKRSGSLKTDGSGLSKRMMINGEREEAYQIEKNVFQTREGIMDIIELGRDIDVD